jgi:Cof subfamily protein (haloacid dehalogenase superfamily)
MRQKQLVIFLDIDGTLYTTTNGTPKENIEAIRQVREQGHMVLLNTGRSYGNIPDEIMEGIPLDGFVSALGSDVRFQGEKLFTQALSQEQLRRIIEFHLEDGRYCVLEGEDDVFAINPRKKDRKKLVTSPDDFDELYSGSRISILAVHGEVSERERELFGDEFYFVEHPGYYECALKGCNKATGMEVVLDHLGKTAQDTIAMGDSMNDLDMLEYAGFSIAMENAVEEVKKACDAVTRTVNEGGVALALREHVLGN